MTCSACGVDPEVDTSEFLGDPDNLKITDFNEVYAIEPALIGIYDLPTGSDLQVVKDELGIRIVETATGREIPREEQFGSVVSRQVSS